MTTKTPQNAKMVIAMDFYIFFKLYFISTLILIKTTIMIKAGYKTLSIREKGDKKDINGIVELCIAFSFSFILFCIF